MTGYLSLAVRVLIATVFVASAAGKARPAGYREHVASVRGFRLVPEPTVRAVAPLVLGAEALVPVLALVPACARIGLALAGALLGMFTVAIASTMYRGVDGRCACFGTGSVPLGRRHLVRNGLLLAAAMVGLAGGPVHLPGAALAGAVGLVLAALAVRYEDLAALVLDPVGRR